MMVAFLPHKMQLLYRQEFVLRASFVVGMEWYAYRKIQSSQMRSLHFCILNAPRCYKCMPWIR
jgi:hypothetical protein